MEIDKYIAELTKLRQTHGPGLEVVTNGAVGPFKKAPLPRVAWVHKEKPKSFFVVGGDPDRLKGDKVVRV